MSRFTRATVVGAVALAALAAPASAHTTDAAPDAPTSPVTERAGTSAGTIVFIKNYNVWIARGNGSGARALTHDGTRAFPYGSPTQSDGGIIVATYNTDLVRMNQQGRVLNRINPGSLPTSADVRIDGSPLDAAISPDGRRIAYTFSKFLSPSGSEPGFRFATGYTASDRLTSPTQYGSTYFWDPSWVGNNRVMQNGGAGSHVNLHDLGGVQHYWFSTDTGDFGNTELSRDGRLLAAIFEDAGETYLAWFNVTGNATSGPPPARPLDDDACQIGSVPGISNPTWGPDNKSLAWQENDGIWTRSGGLDCTQPSALVAPGGSEPHWSPAGLSAPVTTALRNLRRPAITGKAVLGRTLRATTGRWNASGARFTFRWLRGSKVVGTGRAHRVTRADRGRPLVVRVTATKAGYRGASATSRAVRVRR